MVQPLFNYRQISIDTETLQPIYPKGGSWMSVVSLDKIDTPENGKMNFIQMCNSGSRMTKENKDESCWDGCTFEDIDYKKYLATHNDAVMPEFVLSDIVVWLKKNCEEIFHYFEMSRSGKGFHFIFYFNVQKNLHVRNMCKAISIWAIKKAFYSCGYRDVIEYDGVWDTCTNSLYQACFITKNQSCIMENCTGDVTRIVNQNKYSIEKEYNSIFLPSNSHKLSSNVHERTDWGIEWTRSDDTTTIDKYIPHQTRWRVFTSLSGLCGSDDELLAKEWEYCANRMVEDNGHTTQYYIDAPWTLDWNESRTGEEYIDKELLEKFGYKIKFNLKDNEERRKIEKTKPIRKERTYLS